DREKQARTETSGNDSSQEKVFDRATTPGSRSSLARQSQSDGGGRRRRNGVLDSEGSQPFSLRRRSAGYSWWGDVAGDCRPSDNRETRQGQVGQTDEDQDGVGAGAGRQPSHHDPSTPLRAAADGTCQRARETRHFEDRRVRRE